MRLTESDLSAFDARAASRGEAKPKPLKLTKAEPSEAAVLAAILRAMRVHPAVVWFQRMNSGATVIGEGKGRRFIRYGFKGCPDIHGMSTTGKPIYIEVKAPSGRVAPEQREFLDKAEKYGAIAIVARSVSDVWYVLDCEVRGRDGAQKETATSSAF
jgi:hypothetical protein